MKDLTFTAHSACREKPLLENVPKIGDGFELGNTSDP